MRTLTHIRSAIPLLSLAITMSLMAGCTSQPGVTSVRVETVEAEKTGRNVAPVRTQLLEDAKRGVELWIEGDPERLPEVFTEKMMDEWRLARELESADGVKKVRVHAGGEFVPTSLDEEMPRLRYEFVDESYVIDATSGEVVSEPYNVGREVVFAFVKDGDRYKIDTMLGSDDGLR